MLASNMGDLWFELGTGQTKDYEIGETAKTNWLGNMIMCRSGATWTGFSAI